MLLADEINRAMPKTQSALLEAMAEEQVTVDGVTHRLAPPFFVVATQNPMDFAGTYPLPDSQLDRFMLRMSMGYPDRDAERAMLGSVDRKSLLGTLTPCLVPEQIIELRHACATVLASPALVEYVQALLAASRQHPEIRIGLSPRAGLALLAAARAHALLAGRPHCVPEDVQAVFAFVAGHRLTPRRERAARSRQARHATARDDAGALRAWPRRSPHDWDLRIRALAYAEQRLPALTRLRRSESLPIRLDRRRIYVLPTGFGVSFGLLLFVMLIGALNYANNPALLADVSFRRCGRREPLRRVSRR